jgi:hypothetical protein
VLNLALASSQHQSIQSFRQSSDMVSHWQQCRSDINVWCCGREGCSSRWWMLRTGGNVDGWKNRLFGWGEGKHIWPWCREKRLEFLNLVMNSSMSAGVSFTMVVTCCQFSSPPIRYETFCALVKTWGKD